MADKIEATPVEQKMIETLLAAGQGHLFESWPAKGEKDADKQRLLKQCAELDETVPGGIKAYVERARKLLADSKAGVNPYDGFVPEVPTGTRVKTDTKEGCDAFDELEAAGMDQINGACFAMVAGGLGERLGYNGIKVELPFETATETCYLDLYCQSILALQARARAATKDATLLLPLAIMTSGDTDAKTVSLLEKNDYFGMQRSQLTIVKQELVPALLDNNARFSVSDGDPFQVETKPHGHGDIHTLLFQSGLAAKWAAEGRRWLCFFQDTNGLVFRALPAAIGVSIQHELAVNSLAVPRKPGEAVGAICRLEGKESGMTINVEYNQLDALFKANHREDTVDASGCSQFPGNINVLVFDVQSYSRELTKSQGVISEFVNPKYKDAEKMTFQKPTRLECMMQDYPKLLDSSVKVGFSQFERWTSFSAVKNKIADAAKKQAATGIAESGASGEADAYRTARKLLAQAGVAVTVDGAEQTFAGITVQTGAKVVLQPSFATTRAEVRRRIRGSVAISDASTLVLNGDITIENLQLDGALVVDVAPGASLVLKNLKITNRGWALRALPEGSEAEEKYQIRGYTMDKIEHVHLYVAAGAEELEMESDQPCQHLVQGGKLLAYTK